MWILPLALMLTALPQEPKEAPAEIDYKRDIFPIFAESCFECHGPRKQEGDLRFDTREGLFSGDPDALPVVPGDPDLSLIVELCELPSDDPDFMPNGGDPLSSEQLALLRAWITQGAPWEYVESGIPSKPRLVLEPLDKAQEVQREVALSLLRKDGWVALAVADGLHAVDVNFSLGKPAATDKNLEALAGLEPSLVWLNLSGTAITDKGLSQLAKFTQLRRLNLSLTKVTAAGLAHLTMLENLEVLNLYGSSAGDGAGSAIAAMPGLQRVYLWQSAFTAEGASSLAGLRPELKIDRGLEPGVVVVPPPAGVQNKLCPVKGTKVNPSIVSIHEGRPVAFCCTKCQASFDADPSAFAGKLPQAEPKAKPAVINSACPVSGAAVDLAVTSDFEGRLVAFCCGKCKASFDADPSKFKDKLPD